MTPFMDIRDGRPAPRGRGGSPPRPARKDYQSRGEVVGQKKGHILNYSQREN